MLSPTRKVRRRDGSKVPSSEDISWAQEFKALWIHIQRKKVSESTPGLGSQLIFLLRLG